MTRRTLRTLAIAAILTLAAVVGPHPGEARVAVSPQVTDSGVDERISLELRDADVRDVLASFGKVLDVEVEVDPALQGEISIELHNVRAGTALTAVCESSGCLWRLEDGRVVIETDPEAPPEVGGTRGRAEASAAAKLEEPIDMELKDADLRQVLQAFGSIADASVEVDEALSGKVTIELHKTPVRVALDALCRVNDCRWELAETDDGPVMRFRAR